MEDEDAKARAEIAAQELALEDSVAAALTTFEQSKNEPGWKYDAGKPRLDLVPFDALIGSGSVFEYGARKYHDRNWERGMSWGRIVGAMMRHLSAWMMGEEHDRESGLHHLDHLVTFALMLSALVKRGVGTDDRRPS